MNKKLLICGAIATAFLITACVKKEAPKEDEKEQVEMTTQQESQQPVELKPLDQPQEVVIPEHVEVERSETANPAPEVRRETRDTATATIEPTVTPAVKTEPVKPIKAEAPKADEQSTRTAAPQPKHNNAPQTEDDAVNAAIAAATPALNK